MKEAVYRRECYDGVSIRDIINGGKFGLGCVGIGKISKKIRVIMNHHDCYTRNTISIRLSMCYHSQLYNVERFSFLLLRLYNLNAYYYN
jgi:hypothetical protein